MHRISPSVPPTSALLASSNRPRMAIAATIVAVLLNAAPFAVAEPARLSQSTPKATAAGNDTESTPRSSSAFRQPDFSGEAPIGRDRGAGSRSPQCRIPIGSEEVIVQEIVPLIPADSRGLTTHASPRIWFAVTYAAEPTGIAEPIRADFSIENLASNERHRFRFALPKTSGTFAVTVPESLSVGEWHRWYLAISCGSEEFLSPRELLLNEGLIQRVERPQLQQQLAVPSLDRRSRLYAQAGIWYDALDEAARERCQISSRNWTNLLSEVGLTPIAVQENACF